MPLPNFPTPPPPIINEESLSAVNFKSSGLVSSPGRGRGHCAVFLGKTLYYHSDSLHLVGIQMGTSEFYAGSSSSLD